MNFFRLNQIFLIKIKVKINIEDHTYFSPLMIVNLATESGFISVSFVILVEPTFSQESASTKIIFGGLSFRPP